MLLSWSLKPRHKPAERHHYCRLARGGEGGKVLLSVTSASLLNRAGTRAISVRRRSSNVYPQLPHMRVTKDIIAINSVTQFGLTTQAGDTSGLLHHTSHRYTRLRRTLARRLTLTGRRVNGSRPHRRSCRRTPACVRRIGPRVYSRGDAGSRPSSAWSILRGCAMAIKRGWPFPGAPREV